MIYFRELYVKPFKNLLNAMYTRRELEMENVTQEPKNTLGMNSAK